MPLSFQAQGHFCSSHSNLGFLQWKFTTAIRNWTKVKHLTIACWLTLGWAGLNYDRWRRLRTSARAPPSSTTSSGRAGRGGMRRVRSWGVGAGLVRAVLEGLACWRTRTVRTFRWCSTRTRATSASAPSFTPVVLGESGAQTLVPVCHISNT
jgi:hypothetical protein